MKTDTRISKPDIAIELSNRTPFTKKEASVLIDILLDIIVENLQVGRSVQFMKFGVFEPGLARVTGDHTPIPKPGGFSRDTHVERTKVKFRTSMALKRLLTYGDSASGVVNEAEFESEFM
jgi:hypothetical protein